MRENTIAGTALSYADTDSGPPVREEQSHEPLTLVLGEFDYYQARPTNAGTPCHRRVDRQPASAAHPVTH